MSYTTRSSATARMSHLECSALRMASVSHTRLPTATRMVPITMYIT